MALQKRKKTSQSSVKTAPKATSASQTSKTSTFRLFESGRNCEKLVEAHEISTSQ